MSDLRNVQNITVSVVKVFMELCEKYNLRYYFIGGSLIGVMRHQGFIPWDDDVDIGMPRKDYDRFLEILKTDMPEGYGICNRHTDPNWHFNLSQFVDLESEITIHLAQKPRDAHVWIDIFPLDGLPAEEKARKRHVKKILMDRYLVQIAHISTQVDAHRKRPLKERLVIGFCKVIPVGKLINSDKVLDRMEGRLRKYDFDTSDYAANMLGRYREREVVPQKYFGTATFADFEGFPVAVPAMSHELLTALYGDYMQLPPEDKRESHNVTVRKCRTL